MPVAVPAPTVIVMAEVPEPGAGIVVGLKVTVVPDGTPEADKLMELLKPPLTVVVIVDVPWSPWAMLREDGFAEIENVPLPVTVKEVLPLMDPETALIVVVPAATPVARPVVLIVATA